ncbi:peptide ABC transporter substrate-binding protein [Leptotrichia sp. OH3620_COT-345]|uniref:peptide ABC transporter substrate-binding protein n=1 Tax=Leptotrichia sp. OH3620_COT-345 TaxID=2491048 RepID=UPI000F652345|nr:peptide ABC transporter substrate-binding protein [Leptotrichia sp. OH3620_COT-345]RRD40629.1 peptide ABC transporter substrate-binding protein [Leptotrichia sp. OH3620_COT-345]
MKKILLAFTMLMFILACGGKGGSTEGGNSGKKGSTFTLNAVSEPQSIDPQLSTDIVGGAVDDLITEGLLRRSKEGKPVAGLAEKWEATPDGLKWTFHLRDGIKWSNGDPITANDFKAAWLRGLNPETAAEYAYMLYPIKNGEAYNTGKAKAEDVGITVVDDKTLEVTMEAPTPYFDDLITFKTYMPMNEKFYKEVGDKYFTEADKTLSSGPYIMKTWKHDSEMTFEKNPNYWDNANVKVDNIVFKLISDNAAGFNAFKNGEVDVTSITVEQAKEFKDDPRLVTNNDGSVWYLLFNTKTKALSNAKVRKALLMAVNRDELTQTVLSGSGKTAKTFVPSEIGIRGLNKDFAEEVSTTIPVFNPEEAKKLLEEGLKELGMDKFPPFEMIFNDSGNNKLIAEYIQESLRKNLGVELQLSAMTFQERVSRMKQKDFDFVLAGWSGDFHDPITYLDLFVTNGGNNHGSYSNARYDELVRKIKSSADPAVRVPAMIEIEKIIAEEVPVAPLRHGQKRYLVNPKVKGMQFTAIGGEYFFGNLSIEEK